LPLDPHAPCTWRIFFIFGKRYSGGCGKLMAPTTPYIYTYTGRFRCSRGILLLYNIARSRFTARPWNTRTSKISFGFRRTDSGWISHYYPRFIATARLPYFYTYNIHIHIYIYTHNRRSRADDASLCIAPHDIEHLHFIFFFLQICVTVKKCATTAMFNCINDIIFQKLLYRSLSILYVIIIHNIASLEM